MDEEKVLDDTQELDVVGQEEEAEEPEAETVEPEEDLSDGETDEETEEAKPSEPIKEKPKQTPEENAKFAQLRREKEAKEAEAKGKINEVLKPFGVKTVAELLDLEDVQLTASELREAKNKAIENGLDEDTCIELAKSKKERELFRAQVKAQKLHDEAVKANKERADADIAAFKAKYPDVDPAALVKNDKFMIIAKKRLGEDPLIEIWEDFLKVSGEDAEQAAKRQESKMARSTGASNTGKTIQLSPSQKKQFDEWNKRNPNNQFKTPQEFLKYGTR